jgi:hypothetical protein
MHRDYNISRVLEERVSYFSGYTLPGQSMLLRGVWRAGRFYRRTRLDCPPWTVPSQTPSFKLLYRAIPIA